MVNPIGSYETTIQSEADAKAIADEEEALSRAKSEITPIFEELHTSSKFALLSYLHGLARDEKARFY